MARFQCSRYLACLSVPELDAVEAKQVLVARDHERPIHRRERRLAGMLAVAKPAPFRDAHWRCIADTIDECCNTMTCQARRCFGLSWAYQARTRAGTRRNAVCGKIVYVGGGPGRMARERTQECLNA